MDAKKFIVATDNGMMHKMRTPTPARCSSKRRPRATAPPAKARALPVDGDERPRGLAEVLETGANEIHVDPAMGQRARVPIDRMLGSRRR